ncbi:MAG TPA: anti-sigma factor antagonist [Acidiferrobacteraceae bacterium]|nr:anti-sigma factor antagonist [Acidiferrobacteraceae bacterium]
MNPVQVSRQGDEAVISIGERFDFSVHKAFRDAYESSVSDAQVHRYVIDLADTSYVDSSALGMLLVFRDRVAAGDEIAVTNCNREVRNIFQVANFQKLFKIG